MSDKTWKRRERAVADLFGSVRTPLSGGSSRITRSDSLHPRLFVETKLRARHAVVTLWRAVATLAKQENKTPVLALTERGKPGVWLLIRSDDVVAVAKEIEQAGAGR